MADATVLIDRPTIGSHLFTKMKADSGMTTHAFRFGRIESVPRINAKPGKRNFLGIHARGRKLLVTLVAIIFKRCVNRRKFPSTVLTSWRSNRTDVNTIR